MVFVVVWGVKEQYYALKTKYSCHRTYHHLSLWPNSSSFFLKLNEGGSISSWLISVSKEKSFQHDKTPKTMFSS